MTRTERHSGETNHGPSAQRAESGTASFGAIRATTIALNYVLVLGISTLLVTGLIIAGGTFVEDQRSNVVQGELNVVGTHLAGNLEQVDRYAKAGNGDSVAYINQTFQRQVSGESYQVELVPNTGEPEPPQVVLTPNSGDVTVQINTTVQSDIEASTARGGTISIYYEDDSLVIGND